MVLPHPLDPLSLLSLAASNLITSATISNKHSHHQSLNINSPSQKRKNQPHFENKINPQPFLADHSGDIRVIESHSPDFEYSSVESVLVSSPDIHSNAISDNIMPLSVSKSANSDRRMDGTMYDSSVDDNGTASESEQDYLHHLHCQTVGQSLSPGPSSQYRPISSPDRRNQQYQLRSNNPNSMHSDASPSEYRYSGSHFGSMNEPTHSFSHAYSVSHSERRRVGDYGEYHISKNQNPFLRHPMTGHPLHAHSYAHPHPHPHPHHHSQPVNPHSIRPEYQFPGPSPSSSSSISSMALSRGASDLNSLRSQSPAGKDMYSVKRRKRTTPQQLNILLEVFEKDDTPSAQIREELAPKVGMTSREIRIFFQNRRAKVLREKIREENMKAAAVAAAAAAKASTLALEAEQAASQSNVSLGITPSKTSSVVESIHKSTHSSAAMVSKTSAIPIISSSSIKSSSATSSPNSSPRSSRNSIPSLSSSFDTSYSHDSKANSPYRQQHELDLQSHPPPLLSKLPIPRSIHGSETIMSRHVRSSSLNSVSGMQQQGSAMMMKPSVNNYTHNNEEVLQRSSSTLDDNFASRSGYPMQQGLGSSSHGEQTLPRFSYFNEQRSSPPVLASQQQHHQHHQHQHHHQHHPYHPSNGFQAQSHYQAQHPYQRRLSPPTLSTPTPMLHSSPPIMASNNAASVHPRNYRPLYQREIRSSSPSTSLSTFPSASSTAVPPLSSLSWSTVNDRIAPINTTMPHTTDNNTTKPIDPYEREISSDRSLNNESDISNISPMKRSRNNVAQTSLKSSSYAQVGNVNGHASPSGSDLGLVREKSKLHRTETDSMTPFQRSHIGLNGVTGSSQFDEPQGISLYQQKSREQLQQQSFSLQPLHSIPPVQTHHQHHQQQYQLPKLSSLLHDSSLMTKPQSTISSLTIRTNNTNMTEAIQSHTSRDSLSIKMKSAFETNLNSISQRALQDDQSSSRLSPTSPIFVEGNSSNRESSSSNTLPKMIDLGHTPSNSDNNLTSSSSRLTSPSPYPSEASSSESNSSEFKSSSLPSISLMSLHESAPKHQLDDPYSATATDSVNQNLNIKVSPTENPFSVLSLINPTIKTSCDASEAMDSINKHLPEDHRKIPASAPVVSGSIRPW